MKALVCHDTYHIVSFKRFTATLLQAQVDLALGISVLCKAAGTCSWHSTKTDAVCLEAALIEKIQSVPSSTKTMLADLVSSVVGRSSNRPRTLSGRAASAFARGQYASEI